MGQTICWKFAHGSTHGGVNSSGGPQPNQMTRNRMQRMPTRWRMAASCFGSMWPAWSPPKISRATSPGMTRMITNTRAAAPSSVGMIRSSRFAMYVCIPPGSIFGQPHVLELLIGKMIGRRHVVLHLRPVHHGAPPPEARDVVRVVEDDLLDLVDVALALGRVESPCLP